MKTVVRLFFAATMGVSALAVLFYNNVAWDNSGPAVLSLSWLTGTVIGVSGILLLGLAGSYGTWIFRSGVDPSTGRPEIFPKFLRRHTRRTFGITDS